MAIAAAWQTIINDKMDLNEMAYAQLKRSAMYDALTKSADWLGVSSSGSDKRSYKVEFLAGGTGNVRMGGLSASAAIQKAKPVVGLVQSYKDITMSLMFNEKDLEDFEIGSKGYENKVMVSVARQIEGNTQNTKNRIEDQFINGGIVCNVTSIANAATGILVVDRPEKLKIGDNVQLAAADASSDKNKQVFVIGINKNTKAVTFSLTQGGSAGNISTYVASTAALTKIAVDGTVDSAGAITGALDGIKPVLLSAANGGDATYLGLTKTAYPFLQALNINGSTYTSSDILQNIFQSWSTEIALQLTEFKGKKAKNLQVSPLNYAKIAQSYEFHKGSFRKNDDPTLKVFDASKMTIASMETGGELTFERNESLSDDVMYGLNMESWRLISNKALSYRKGEIQPSGYLGYSWYTERVAGDGGGYTHILDGGMSAQIVCGSPESNFVIHGLSL